MKPTFEITNCVINSVAQLHDGKLEVVKTYTIESGDIKKKEVYEAIDNRIELVRVEDVAE